MNCAGFGAFAPFLEQSADEINRLMRVNFEAAAEMTRALLPGLLTTGTQSHPSHVFNICSMAAGVGPHGHSGYAASKGAMRTFTESLQAEYASRHVIFTIVYPGIIRTEYFEKGTMRDLWPLVKKRAISPQRVSEAVVRSIGRNRLTLYVPRSYQLLNWIAAASPRAARRIVRWGMS